MSQPLISLLSLPATAFPIEVFGYPEDSPGDYDPIFHAVVSDPEVVAPFPIPSQRMRMKLVLADGTIMQGTER